MVTGVHLVGSVPLKDAETVFRIVAGALGVRLATLPDGETGARKDWIAWQYPVLAASEGLEPVPAGERGYLRRQLVRREPGTALRIGPLGYARAALESYAVFERLQREGAIPAHVRFQVALPTPLAPVSVFVELADRAAVEPAYEAALLAELDQIGRGIPHDRLAVQWDVAAEFGLIERIWPAHFADVEQGVLARIGRLAAAVPAGVPVGFHLCYGDFGHRHFVNPPDAGRLVRVANGIAALGRPVAWVHLPVPITWTAPAAYAPLAGLRLAPETRLHLGLVHAEDGLAGARRRLAHVEPLVPRLGLATECGWGRRSPDAVPALLGLLAALAPPGGHA